MILFNILSFLCFIVSIIFYTKSQQRAFEDRDSWENKYKKPLQVAPKNWYYRLFKLTYREKFPLSGSFLVALTDNYHRFQMFFKVLMCASIALYRPVLGFWDGLIYFVVWGITFTLVYKK